VVNELYGNWGLVKKHENTEGLEGTGKRGPKKAPKKSREKKRTKENVPSNLSDHTYANLSSEVPGTKSGKGHGNKARTLKPVSLNNHDQPSSNHVVEDLNSTVVSKGSSQGSGRVLADQTPMDNEVSMCSGENQAEDVVCISSDEEWHDDSLSIDVDTLGTRASARKTNKNISYTENEEVDVSVDESVADKNEGNSQEVSKFVESNLSTAATSVYNFVAVM